MTTRMIGDLTVSAVGLGAMTLTQLPDFDSAVGQRAIDCALEHGITLFDTADSYGPTSDMGVNESELARLLGSRVRDVVVSTKGGHTRHENASWWINGAPDHLAQAARNSAQRLGLDALPLYHLHRPDPQIDFRASVEALARLCDDGVVQRVGVSNVNAQQLAIAIEVLGPTLVSVQNELSPLRTESLDLLDTCEAHDIAFLAWGPFGGLRAAQGLGQVAPPFLRVARLYGVSVYRVVLAWMLALSPAIIPIPGGRRPSSIIDSAAAPTLTLARHELAALNTFAFGSARRPTLVVV
ncbi:aldo/keto reductase [Microbacterium sp. YY-03]|uniref:aldo/keto reductase n=1 Tax=Microbacterium sp. YY-03 TaxID=3421636 RepID=UPI003D181A48